MPPPATDDQLIDVNDQLEEDQQVAPIDRDADMGYPPGGEDPGAEEEMRRQQQYYATQTNQHLLSNGFNVTQDELNQDLAGDLRPNTAGEQPPASNIMDSDVKAILSRNFAKKVANSKKLNEETKESVTLMRNQFLIYLAKVYDNATKKDGVLGCHRII